MGVKPWLVPAAERVDLGPVRGGLGLGEVAGHDHGVLAREHHGLDECRAVLGGRQLEHLPAILGLRMHRLVAQVNVRLDRDDPQLEADEQAEGPVRARQRAKQVGVLGLGHAQALAGRGHELVGDHRLGEQPDLVRVGGHRDGHREATEGRLGDLEVDREHVAALEQVAGHLADGHERLDMDGAAVLLIGGVDREDVAEPAQLDFVPLVFGREPGREAHPGLAVGAHRPALRCRLCGPASDLGLDFGDLLVVALRGGAEQVVEPGAEPQDGVEHEAHGQSDADEDQRLVAGQEVAHGACEGHRATAFHQDRLGQQGQGRRGERAARPQKLLC